MSNTQIVDSNKKPNTYMISVWLRYLASIDHHVKCTLSESYII